MRIKSNKLRKSAKGQECQVRLPGVCSWDDSQTVLAHVGKDSGMGMKASDIEATFACGNCHAVMDGQVNHNFERDFVRLAMLEGAERTRAIWVEQGLIQVK